MTVNQSTNCNAIRQIRKRSFRGIRPNGKWLLRTISLQGKLVTEFIMNIQHEIIIIEQMSKFPTYCVHKDRYPHLYRLQSRFMRGPQYASNIRISYLAKLDFTTKCIVSNLPMYYGYCLKLSDRENFRSRQRTTLHGAVANRRCVQASAHMAMAIQRWWSASRQTERPSHRLTPAVWGLPSI
jgi:hypothetical protein